MSAVVGLKEFMPVLENISKIKSNIGRSIDSFRSIISDFNESTTIQIFERIYRNVEHMQEEIKDLKNTVWAISAIYTKGTDNETLEELEVYEINARILKGSLERFRRSRERFRRSRETSDFHPCTRPTVRACPARSHIKPCTHLNLP